MSTSRARRARAVGHLIGLGHARIAYVAGPSGRAESADQRHTGYRSALADQGLKPMTPERPSPREPIDAMRRAVVEDGASALLVHDHTTAVRLLRVAAVLGLRVPEDVSIVCFGDAFPCADVLPALTAIASPGSEIGDRAAELLCAQIRDDGDPVDRVLDAQIIVRDSTGSAPR